MAEQLNNLGRDTIPLRKTAPSNGDRREKERARGGEEDRGRERAQEEEREGERARGGEEERGRERAQEEERGRERAREEEREEESDEDQEEVMAEDGTLPASESSGPQ